jgi:hypothetical protein
MEKGYYVDFNYFFIQFHNNVYFKIEKYILLKIIILYIIKIDLKNIKY